MACGSRPVKDIPQPGAFPTVGIRQGPGIAKGEAFSPLARRRSPEVNRTPMSARRKRNKSFPATMRAAPFTR
ncbi:hypothetical protein GCM10027295_08140 [Pseudaeromonas pectinilytica]